MTEKKDIIYKYKMRRRNFGKEVLFKDQGPEMLCSVPYNELIEAKYILRNPVKNGMQHSKGLREHWVNSDRVEHTDSGMNHVEGGWPKDIDVKDPEAMERYRRKIEKDDGFLRTLMHLEDSMQHNVLQNNAIDMYQKYYTDVVADGNVGIKENSSCNTINLYREPGATRPVRSLSWQADGGAKIAAAHADLALGHNPRNVQYSFIWDIENANTPDVIVKPPYALIDLEYHPRDPNILIGGMVGWWDLRQSAKPAICSPYAEPAGVCCPYTGHRDLVRNVIFTQSKIGLDFLSSSPDGVVNWWDIRKMIEPTYSLIMDLVKSPNDTPSIDNAIGVSALDFDPAFMARFKVGLENGLVIQGNRKGQTHYEKILIKYKAHLGPVYALQRHPAIGKTFMSVGDWTFKVWSEECRESPIIWTHSHRTKLTDGVWNPIRFSVILITQRDGCLSVWDLLRRRSGAVVTAQVCDDPLYRVRPHEGGILVASGSSKGTVYLSELSQDLGSPERCDKQFLSQVFDNEKERERILEEQRKLNELKLKLLRQKGNEAPAVEAEDCTEDLLAKATADYLKTVNEFDEKIG